MNDIHAAGQMTAVDLNLINTVLLIFMNHCLDNPSAYVKQVQQNLARIFQCVSNACFRIEGIGIILIQPDAVRTGVIL